MILIDVRALRFPTVSGWVSRVSETIQVAFVEPPGTPQYILPDKFRSLGAVVAPTREMDESVFWLTVFRNFPADTLLTESQQVEPIAAALVSDGGPAAHLVYDDELDMIVVV